MFDFPASPTVGQAYTSAGVTYVWNGTAWMQTSAAQVQGVQYPAHGGCILELVDIANVRVRPCNGNRIIIDGVSRQITGTTVLNKSLTASATKLYLYAYWTGTAVAYEFTATNHTTHTDGVEIMIGDPSRTFIGMVYLYSNLDFRDDVAARLVASWFNRKNKVVVGVANGVAFTSTGGATAGVVGYFLSFANDIVVAYVEGQVNCPATNTICLTTPWFDNAAGVECGVTGYTAGAYVPAGGYNTATYPTTTLHSVAVGGRIAPSGTMTIYARAIAELFM